ncbi:ChrR family anti-sigma-E factor [Cohaesibacter intestini]|uniref:ChrR family anti-sigma-E factor n=1 Tax=Cohaesibacter intestini TaxID=2211145 RepID=UPI000DEACA01|nr:ChrR family anti-sigma-E factor [Cohaesibacter intestini]
MIHHHLSDEMILAYAAGSLPVGHALLVACHLEVCPHCAARVAEAEAIGGAMLNQCEDMVVSDDLFDRMMASIDEDESLQQGSTFPEAPFNRPGMDLAQSAAPPALGSSLMPTKLAAVIGDDIEAIRWRAVGPGIKQFVLPMQGSEGETVRLLKLSPGFITPEHSHNGSELTMVLKGSFSDESGRYRVGDIQDADDSVHHQPMADTEEECICLTVTDAPLEFKGMITRLLQPIIGI